MEKISLYCYLLPRENCIYTSYCLFQFRKLHQLEIKVLNENFSAVGITNFITIWEPEIVNYFGLQANASEN